VGGYAAYANLRFYIIRCGKVTKIDRRAALLDKEKDVPREACALICVPYTQW